MLLPVLTMRPGLDSKCKPITTRTEQAAKQTSNQKAAKQKLTRSQHVKQDLTQTVL